MSWMVITGEVTSTRQLYMTTASREDLFFETEALTRALLL